MNAPQPPYSSPGSGQGWQQSYPPQQSFAPAPKKGMGTAALVLGILAIVLAFIPIFGFVSSSISVGIGVPASISVGSVVPAPITRAELMTRYAQINSIDISATPDVIDRLAENSCFLLAEGASTDLLISTATSIFASNATEVTRLLVSYGCPKYLKDFK